MFTARTASATPGRSAGHLYRQVAIDSQVRGDASAHRLVEMLFDGFMEAIAQARGALLEAQVEHKGAAITRALRIVDEGLRAPLDLHGGGTLAADLRDLYAYICVRLLHANLHNDDDALDECQRLMRPLRDAWAAIAPGQRQAM